MDKQLRTEPAQNTQNVVHILAGKSPAKEGAYAGKLELLLEVVQKLSLAKDLETIMNIVRKAARKLVDADGATFVLRDDGKCYYADEDAIAPLWKGKRFPLSMCISGWAMLNRQSVIIEDIYQDSRIPIDAYRVTFVKSLLMTPIRTSDPIGAIGTYWAEKYKPTEEQVNLMKALADSTSVAMENIQLHQEVVQGGKETNEQVQISNELRKANKDLETTLNELNHRNQDMLWLKELSSSLQTCISTEEGYKLVAQYLQKLLPTMAGTYYTMHPSRNYLESMITWNDPKGDEKIIKPEDCLSLRRGTMYKVEETEKSQICQHYSAVEKLNPYICVPLYAQNDIIGLMCLEWQEKLTQDEIQKKNDTLLLEMIIEQVAIGFSNIKLRETLRNLSLHDPLTNLYNRRYLEETIERELSRCGRKNATLALLMIDVDHFKQFNDQYGHEAGDMVLQALANVLRTAPRKEDIACRFGGEEFVFVMPEISLETTLQRAEELHKAIRDVHLRYGGNALSQITISIGVAMFPDNGKTLTDLIAAADTALYQAKNTGRNKTVVFKPDA